jgi:hypothetical protein
LNFINPTQKKAHREITFNAILSENVADESAYAFANEESQFPADFPRFNPTKLV